MAVRRKNRSQEVAEAIRNYIVQNDMRPGQMLPSIEKLAEMFGASRGTVREALMNLASAGMVRIEQGRGTSVSSPEIDNILSSVIWGTALESVSTAEIVQARIAVESHAVVLAASNASSTEIANLRHLGIEMQTALEHEDYQTYLDLDRQWHHAISKMSRNRLLTELTASLHALSMHDVPPEHVQNTGRSELELHDGVVDALERHDVDHARSLLVRHIEEYHAPWVRRNLSVYCDALGTGSVGGSFYTLGQEIARLLHQHFGRNPRVYATGGGMENLALTHDGHISLSIVQADLAVSAFHGREPYDQPHRKLRALCRLPGLELQIVTLEALGISTIKDLRGRSIAMGARGGASLRVASEVLRRHGLIEGRDYDAQQHPISSAVHCLLEGKVDAVCFLSIGQSAALLELACEASIRLLPLEKRHIREMVADHPMWYECTVEANTYPNQSGSVETIGVQTLLVCHSGMTDADAYAVTSTILTNIDSIRAAVRPYGKFGLDEATSDIGIPLHPGAGRYLYELGLLVHDGGGLTIGHKG